MDECYYATSHAWVGSTFPVGCMSINGKMSISITVPWPLINRRMSKTFADAFVELLEAIADVDMK